MMGLGVGAGGSFDAEKSRRETTDSLVLQTSASPYCYILMLFFGLGAVNVLSSTDGSRFLSGKGYSSSCYTRPISWAWYGLNTVSSQGRKIGISLQISKVKFRIQG